MSILADVTVTFKTETIWMWTGIAYGSIQTYLAMRIWRNIHGK